MDEQAESPRAVTVEQDSQSPGISVVLPVFEEAEAIADVIQEIADRLNDLGQEFEILAVDDGSKDGTAEVLDGLRQRLGGHLRVARHVYNKGNGAALRTGARLARGDVVVYMDSDGQHQASEIPKLLDRIPPFDLVIGARDHRYKSAWHRKLANRFYNRFASWLSKSQVTDLTSGFRAMRRKPLQHFLPLYPSGFSTPTTITLSFLKAGYNVTYVPVEVRRRRKGSSKISLWRDGSTFVLIILRMIMLYDPLRIFLPVSVSLSLLGVLAWIAGAVQAQRLVLPNSAIFLFTAALISMLLGLVSGQVSSSRIFYHGDETVLVDDEPTELR
jgi:glycosyltransferase involved in cell wall biosynthesis